MATIRDGESVDNSVEITPFSGLVMGVRIGNILGIAVDPERNAAAVDIEARISPDGAPVDVWAIPTDEEFVIASEALRVARGGA